MASGSSSSPFFGFKDEDVRRQQAAATATATSSVVQNSSTASAVPPQPKKKKRNQPGTPNPDAEVIALSPKSLLATNRFVCEVCNKGFQREQNLQLHRRGHNLPWKLRQKGTKEVRRRVYLCPEPTCVHHDPSRALGDLTGIKKHFCRKHGEKKWKCDKCSKRYAVQSDWKAHSKTCGTREYRCDCGTLFSRRDSFITHRAFCDALAQEGSGLPTAIAAIGNHPFEGANTINIPLPHLTSQASSSHQAQNLPSSDNLHNTNHLLFSSFRPFEPPTFFAAPDETQFQSKPFHGLMQFPENTASVTPNAFNLGFLFNNSNTGQSPQLPITDQLNAISDNVNDKPIFHGSLMEHSLFNGTSAQMSATALLQKAAQMGASASGNDPSPMRCFTSSSSSSNGRQANLFNSDNEAHFQDLMNSLVNEQDAGFEGFHANMAMTGEPKARAGRSEGLTRDFLGVGAMQLGPLDPEMKMPNVRSFPR